MLSLIVLYFATTALSAPTASPSSVPQPGTFSVQAKRNPNYKPDGPSDLLRMYKRYGITPPEGHEAYVSNLQKRQYSQGSVVATPNGNDLQYLCPVSVGGQTLNINFDTGSSDFWVFSSSQPSSQTTGHSIYDPSQSKSSKVMAGSTWSIGYGDGSAASGTVVTDDVTIGGVTVTSQAVEIATSVSTQFTANTNSDGILGLAFSGLNNVQPDYVDTWLDNASKSLAQKLFTVDLRKASTGSYNFGYIDNSKYTGALKYSDVDSSRGYWGFSASAGFFVNNKRYNDPIGAPHGAIADTGSTFILLPDGIVKTFYSAIKGARYASAQGGWIFPCNAKIPTLKLAVGNNYSTVTSNVLNYSKVSSTMCFGGVQSMGSQSTSLPYIYGDVWFKSQFVVFDAQNMKLGFAPKK